VGWGEGGSECESVLLKVCVCVFWYVVLPQATTDRVLSPQDGRCVCGGALKEHLLFVKSMSPCLMGWTEYCPLAGHEPVSGCSNIINVLIL